MTISSRSFASWALPTLLSIHVLSAAAALAQAQEPVSEPPPGPALDPQPPPQTPTQAQTQPEPSAEPAPTQAPPSEPPPATPAPVYTAPPVVEEAPQPAEPTPAPSPPPPAGVGIRPTASFFTRFELREGYDDLGVSGGRFVEGDATFYRARLGLVTDPIEVADDLAVLIRFVPQASGRFGTLPSTIADAALGLHEGYLRLQGSAISIDFGRFELDYGEALVIGNLGWHETARSFDGGRAHITPGGSEGGWIDLFLTQLAEGHGTFTEPFGAGDGYFIGIYSDVGPWLTAGLALDLYALASVSPATDDVPVSADPADGSFDRDSATELTLGTRIKQRLGAFDYRLEAGVQVGERLPPMAMDAVTATAHHADVEIGVSLAGDALRLSIEGLYASGNDPASSDLEGWNQLFPTAHKFLGLSDIFGARTNVMSGVAHVAYKPAGDFTLKLDAHVFSRPEPTPAGADGYAGSELDLIAVYALGKGLTLGTVLAAFLPGDDYPVDEPAYYVEVELRYELK